LGYYTDAPSYLETTTGSFNTTYTPLNTDSWNLQDRLFVIGNGSDINNKSDALIVYKNGKSNFKGLVRIDAGATDGLLVTGSYNLGHTIDDEITGGGTLMFFNPKKAAFRAGYDDGNNWNDANIGAYSMALGNKTKASGDFSFATGILTTASGNSSTAMGNNTTASGNYTTAIGDYSTASGDNSTAIGYHAAAAGNYSTALGRHTFAPSYGETVIGSYNTFYPANSSTSWDASDRLFVIGNGEDVNSKSDALIVYKNGNTELHEKLIAPLSGNADLKPYIYGSLRDNDGYAYPAESTTGFTSTKESTGVYKITFDSYNSDKNYLVIANALRTSAPVILTYEKDFGFFRVRAWSLSGMLTDTYFNFVVYKK